MPDPQPAGAPRRHRDMAELLAGATERTVLAEVPGKSGARLERVVIGGQPYVLERIDLAEDWTMRASGCLRGASFTLWLVADYDGTPSHPIGRSLRRGSDRAGPCAHATVVLKWAGPNNYYVLTSYPECRE